MQICYLWRKELAPICAGVHRWGLFTATVSKEGERLWEISGFLVRRRGSYSQEDVYAVCVWQGRGFSNCFWPIIFLQICLDWANYQYQKSIGISPGDSSDTLWLLPDLQLHHPGPTSQGFPLIHTPIFSSCFCIYASGHTWAHSSLNWWYSMCNLGGNHCIWRAWLL